MNDRKRHGIQILKSLREKILSFRGIHWILALLCSVLLFIMMETANRNPKWFQMDLALILINISTYMVVITALRLVTGKWAIGCCVCSVLFTVLATVNVYSLDFRWMPISTRDIHSVKTAWNVLDAYQIKLNKQVVFILVLGCVMLLISAFLWYMEQKKRTLKVWILQIAGGTVGITLFFSVCYFRSSSLIPQEGVGWTWEETYHNYGFLAASIEVAKQSAYKVKPPRGYTDEIIERSRGELSGRPGQETPDIILILNESWYDFSLIADFETNEPISPFIDNLENCINGYAVVPGIGGGTNSSEYELLTGNSLQLMPGITPFSSLNMEEQATIVTVLEEQGYETTAFHPAPGSNYSRNLAYPAMGFDRIYFENDVDGLEFWKQRVSFATDESDFTILTELYEFGLKEGNSPLFLYNLTIQNHGGYALVSADQVPLQVTTGMEDMDEWSIYEINEYLSCLNMTDKAFQKLTAYFETVERPVIICMVGDHCPNIAPKFVNKNLTEEEEMLYLHSTPFLIWSNQGLEQENWGFLGMSCLMPKLLDVAGTGLPPYYQYIVEELIWETPIITSFGYYQGEDGNFYSYEDETVYTNQINTYLAMEYWNATGHLGDLLFEVP